MSSNIFKGIFFWGVGSAGKESACNAGDPGSDSWAGKIHYKRDRIHTPVFLGLPGSSASKESACNVEDLGSIPGLGRSLGEGKGYPTPVFWPGEFNGLYSPWGRRESDTTEWLSLSEKKRARSCMHTGDMWFYKHDLDNCERKQSLWTVHSRDKNCT